MTLFPFSVKKLKDATAPWHSATPHCVDHMFPSIWELSRNFLMGIE
ncbi:hypothetical protein VCRA2120E57_120031 [Vibrio crassostreae]|nr:hypothetical protein VCRA2120E57_120031 [Vibrio crassostreae]